MLNPINHSRSGDSKSAGEATLRLPDIIPMSVSLADTSFEDGKSTSKKLTKTEAPPSLNRVAPFKERDVSKKLPLSLTAPLVAPFRFERQAYEYLGIRIFQKWVPTVDWFYKSPLSTKQRDENEQERDSRLRRFANATTVFEGCHAVGGSCWINLTFRWLAEGEVTGALVLTACNILINAYPIMSQRYNRARIWNILNKQMQNKSEHLSRPVE